jgi:hypothetical protein
MRRTVLVMLAVLLVAVAAASGRHACVADGTFGLRTIEVRDLRSPDEGVYSYAQDSARRAHVPGGGDCVAEAGGALLGGALVGTGATVVLGVAGAALLSSPGAAGDDWGAAFGALLGGAAGALVGYPLGCGLGATLVGTATHADGNTGAAYGGAYGGLALGALAGLVSRNWGVGLVGAGVLTPAGAVIGYNTGVSSSLGARIAPPTLAYRSRLGPDQQRYTTFDCRLVTVRF